MRAAGGIIALIAGLLGFVAAIATLFLGGMGAALDADGGELVVALGWGGVLFSFLVIIFSAMALGVRQRWVGFALLLSAIAGAVLGGTLVAVAMVLAAIGGILVMLGAGNKGNDTTSSTAVDEASQSKKGGAWIYVGVTVVALSVIGLLVGSLNEFDGDGSSNVIAADDDVRPLDPYSEAAIVGDFHVQISEIRTATAVGNAPFIRESEDGELLILVSVQYRNESDAPVPSHRQPRIQLVDPVGNQYSADVGASTAYATEADWSANVISDLNPGISRTDGSAFVVAASRFDPGNWLIEVSSRRESALFAFQALESGPGPEESSLSNLEPEEERDSSVSTGEAAGTASRGQANSTAGSPTLDRDAGIRPGVNASFDCQDATQTAEVLICSTDQLRRLDREMGEAYHRVRSRTDGAIRSDLISSQRSWIRDRDRACEVELNPFRSGTALATAQSCFEEMTMARLEVLNQRFTDLFMSDMYIDPATTELYRERSEIYGTTIHRGSPFAAYRNDGHYPFIAFTQSATGNAALACDSRDIYFILQEFEARLIVGENYPVEFASASNVTAVNALHNSSPPGSLADWEPLWRGARVFQLEAVAIDTDTLVVPVSSGGVRGRQAFVDELLIGAHGRFSFAGYRTHRALGAGRAGVSLFGSECPDAAKATLRPGGQ